MDNSCGKGQKHNTVQENNTVQEDNTVHQQNPLITELPCQPFLESTMQLLLSPQPLLGLNQALNRVIGEGISRNIEINYI